MWRIIFSSNSYFFGKHSMKEPLAKIFQKHLPPEGVPGWRQSAEIRDKKIVLTNGVFDIIHKGHVSYLCQARALGDLLVVALNSDDSVSRLKGPARPLNKLQDRMFVMAALEMVDYVTYFTEDNPVEIIKKVKPGIHVKGGDYRMADLPEADTVKELGGRIVLIPFVAGYSTTSLIKKFTPKER
jgi:rfaE bifunctional protein nucleotidyltransferase chain/domain